MRKISKFLVLPLIIALCISMFAACGKKNNNNNKDVNTEDQQKETNSTSADNKNELNKEEDEDRERYKFSIDGKVFELYTTYKEIKESTGYSIKSSEEKTYIKPGRYASVQLTDSDNDSICYIDIFNNTNENITCEDGVIIQIYQSQSQKKENVNIEFVGGLHVGDVISEDELIELMGNPNEYIGGSAVESFKEYEILYFYGWSEDIRLSICRKLQITVDHRTDIIESISVSDYAIYSQEIGLA